MKLIPKMIGDVLANVFRKPFTTDYPKTQPKVGDNFRGEVKVNSNCISCGACARACPADAIKITEEYIEVYPLRCIGCARCQEVCPVNAIHLTKTFDHVKSSREDTFKLVYELAKCTACGKVLGNKQKFVYMAEKTKKPLEEFLVCPQCKAAAAKK